MQEAEPRADIGLDPPAELDRLAPRPTDLDGLTLGVLDCGALSGKTVLDALSGQLERRHFLTGVVALPQAGAVASRCDALIVGLADDDIRRAVADAVTAEREAVPTVLIVEETRLTRARAEAEALGLAGLPCVATPGAAWPDGQSPPSSEELSRVVADVEHALCSNPLHTVARDAGTGEGSGVSCLC